MNNDTEFVGGDACGELFPFSDDKPIKVRINITDESGNVIDTIFYTRPRIDAGKQKPQK